MNYSPILMYGTVGQACAKWMQSKGINFDYGRESIPMWAIFEFANLLGFKMIHRNGVDLFPLEDPEAKRLIDLINSPHGNTILKMLEIKRRDENGNSNSASQ
jgi:hypothetical protein